MFFFSGIFPVLGDVRRANNVKMVDDGKIAETRLGMKVRKWLAAYKEDRSRRVLSTPTSDGDGPAHTLSVIFVIDNRPMPQLHTTHSDYLQFNNWLRSKYSL